MASVREAKVLMATRGEGICCLEWRHSRLSSECAFAEPPHEHLGQIIENGWTTTARVLSRNSEDIDVALKKTGRFVTVTQQKLNVDKPSSGAPLKLRCNL